jgi:Flp pilus assembly protein TadG
MTNLTTRRKRLAADKRGVIAVAAAIMFVPIFGGMASLGLDMSNWYAKLGSMQKAADAAALAGVTHLPGDPNQAFAVAEDFSSRNGWNSSETTTVTSEVGDTPSQLKVTVTTTVPNTFGVLLGAPKQYLSRTAVADYSPGIEMGSNCNVLGNEPNDRWGETYTGDAQYNLSNGVGCPRDQGFYLRAAFPGNANSIIDKSYGDRYLTDTCRTAGIYGCDGNNDEYRPTGYFYKMTIDQPGWLQPEIFNPALVHTGTTCSDQPRGLWATNNLNWNVTDGNQRYSGAKPSDANVAPAYGTGAGSQVSWCTGDFSGYLASGDPSVAGTDRDAIQGLGGTTLVGVRKDTGGDPLSGELISGCSKKFDTYVGDLRKGLDRTKPEYDADMADAFRQWVQLCNIEAPEAGTYWIQVRTDFPDSVTDLDSALNSRTQGPSTAAGLNGFSLRARLDALTYNGGVDFNDSVHLSAFGRLSLFQNTATSKRFNIANVPTSMAGKSLNITFYDVGDISTGTVTLQVRGTNNQRLPTCTATGPISGSVAGCELTGLSAATHGGKLQTMRVPIPADYVCDESGPYGCNFGLYMKTVGGASPFMYDTTTWTVAVDANPVRLVF